MAQSKIRDHMHWSEAVRNNLLFCDICGKQIQQGCTMDENRKIICDECEEK